MYLRFQPLGTLLTAAGISPHYVITLEVPGRRSGVIRRTTLVRVARDGGHYLVALAGESEWVRNVRAAGGASRAWPQAPARGQASRGAGE